jgi:hypothetical protein
MPWKASVLVVANVTATSPELLAAMAGRATQGPVSFTLVMPAASVGAPARQRAEAALATALDVMRRRALEVDGVVGDPDPFVAVLDVFDPRRFDDLIVSTLPSGASNWLQIDLAHRLARVTGLAVRHVESSLPRVAPAVVKAPAPQPPPGLLAPLRVLYWAGERRSGRGHG